MTGKTWFWPVVYGIIIFVLIALLAVFSYDIIMPLVKAPEPATPAPTATTPPTAKPTEPASPTWTPSPTPTNTPTSTPVPPTPVSNLVPTAPESSTSGWVASCDNLTAPQGGQIFWSNHRVGLKDPYAVVYDPAQGGSADHPALGWYYQPCLPAGPQRITHQVAIVLQPDRYRFTGPECSVWLNTDKNHPWEQGTLLINRQNMLSINISTTSGTSLAESWVAVKCMASWASGFSFEKLP